MIGVLMFLLYLVVGVLVFAGIMAVLAKTVWRKAPKIARAVKDKANEIDKELSK